jgi:hypothetical protein
VIKIDGNKTNAVGTMAAVAGALGLAPEALVQIPEPSNAVLLVAIGLVALTLRDAIRKLTRNVG